MEGNGPAPLHSKPLPTRLIKNVVDEMNDTTPPHSTLLHPVHLTVCEAPHPPSRLAGVPLPTQGRAKPCLHTPPEGRRRNDTVGYQREREREREGGEGEREGWGKKQRILIWW